MGGRHVTSLLGLTLVAAAILLFQNINAQTCTADATGSGTVTWPVTWVPESTPEFKFSVKCAANCVVELLLAPDNTGTTSYLKVTLGSNAANDGAGADAAAAVSYISVCTAADVCTATEAKSTSNGLITTAYQDFVLSATTNSVHVAYDGEEDFLSLNNLGSTSLFDTQNIRFVGLKSDDGTIIAPATKQSDWKFCTDDWTDITGTVSVSMCTRPDSGTCVGDEVLDKNIDTTYTGSGSCLAIANNGDASFWRLDMTEEKHIVGVTIYNGGTSANLDGVGVFVGSCLDQTDASLTFANIQDNILCSGVFSGVTSAGPFYKACPTNTYGQHVFIAHNGDSGFELCEVVIHGNDIPDIDKTKIEFSSATYSVMEPLDLTRCNGGTSQELFEVSTQRTSGSASTLTCSEFGFSVSGSATSGIDYIPVPPLSHVQVVFGPGETSVPVFSISGDCMTEDDETIILELTNPTAGQLIGSTSSTTVTILDDDPKYKFSASSDSVWENEPSGKITLTVERSDYTDVRTTIHVDIAVCTSEDPTVLATADDDFTEEMDKAVTFESGMLTQTVDIYIANDDGNVDAKDEKLCVTLDPDVSRRGQLVAPDTIEVTILNDDTVYQFSSATYSGGENDGEITVLILREGKTDTTGCIDVFSEHAELTSGVSPATAGNDNDYPAYRETITFDANEKSKEIFIPINNDEEVEDDETFKLSLALPTTPCGADWSAVVGTDDTDGHSPDTTLTIEDDDSTYSVVTLTTNVPENAGTVTVSFERNPVIGSGTITVEVSGGKDEDTNIGTSIATEEVDFMNAGRHTLKFETGEPTASLTIPIVDDSYIELNEVFSVEIVEADGEINEGRKTTDIYITNNDAYFSIKEAERTVIESVNEFLVVIQRGPLVVDGVTVFPYLENEVNIVVNTNSEQSSNGATADSDFVTQSKVLKFSAGEAVKTCAIEVINDELVEGPEVFFVTISNDNVQIDPERSQSKITIEDDDGRITCSVDGETTVSIDEDEDDITVTCTRNGINNEDGDDQSLNREAKIVVTAVFSGSARQGQDFNAYSATWTFPPNEGTITETINGLIIDDTEPENDKSFTLKITSTDSEIDTSSSVITVTILDDDVVQFGFEEMEYTVGESCDSLQVVITRTSGNSVQGTTLRITASDGAGSTGATYPDDYATREATVQFLGQQQQQIVTIDIKKDNVNEGSELFSLTLSKVSGSGEVNPAARTATITIEDQTVTYSVQDARITREESSGTMPVTFVRSGDFCGADNIYVSTVDGTARSREDDYISFNNRLVTFARGSTTASVDLAILDDDIEESTETFSVEIESTNNIQIGTGTTIVTIQDDDGRVSFRESEYNVVEGSGTVTLTIDRVGSAITPTQVRVQTVRGQGTAIPGSDYTAVSTIFVEYEASQTSKTFTVSIIDDNEVEDAETFTVAIISTTDGTVSDPSEAVVTIEDDDDEPSPGFSIVAITAGIGGVFLLVVLIGGLVCVILIKSSSGAGAGAGAAAGAAAGPPPIGYNGPAGYPPNFRYGPDYGRPQMVAYYQ